MKELLLLLLLTQVAIQCMVEIPYNTKIYGKCERIGIKYYCVSNGLIDTGKNCTRDGVCFIQF
jgi:hypothetical protein